MFPIRRHPLTWLMLIATLAVDCAALVNLERVRQSEPWAVHDKWRDLLVWGGWAQWSAMALWVALGGGRHLVRASWLTIAAALFCAVCYRFAPHIAVVYIGLAGLQVLTVASLGCLAKKLGGTDTWLGDDPLRDGPPRFTTAQLLGWTTLAAMWMAATRDIHLLDFGDSPWLGIINLAGAPFLALVALGRPTSSSARRTICVLAGAASIGLGYFSTVWLYRGPWYGLVATRVVVSNLVQVLYLVAWWEVIRLDRSVELRRAPAARKKIARWFQVESS
jgi:hypothetical protein